MLILTRKVDQGIVISGNPLETAPLKNAARSTTRRRFTGSMPERAGL